MDRGRRALGLGGSDRACPCAIGLRDRLRARVEGLRVRDPDRRHGSDLPHQHQRLEARPCRRRPGEPVQSCGSARQAGEPGRGRPQPRHALLDRLAQPLAPAAGPARAEDAPLLRLRAGLPVDRELPQHRHDHRPGGRRRLCDRRPRVRRQAAARRDQGEVAVQPRLDDRAHLHQGRGRHRAGQQDPGLLRPPAAEDLRRDVPPAGDQAGRHDRRSSADRGARARPGSAPVLCLARQADDQVPAAHGGRAAARAADRDRGRPRPRPEHRPEPERGDAAGNARRGHPGPRERAGRDREALPGSVRPPQRLSDREHRQLRDRLHAAGADRQDRGRGAEAEDRDLRVHADGQRPEPAGRQLALRPAHPRRSAPDPRGAVLVGDDVRHRDLPGPEPDRPLPDQRSLEPAPQPRRLAGHLRAVGAAVGSPAGSELAPLARGRRRLQADLALL